MKYVVKIVVALAAAVGAVYLLATKGEEIVAWAKEMLDKISNCKCCCKCGEECTCEAEDEACCCEAEGETCCCEAAEEVAEAAEEVAETVEEAAEEVVEAVEEVTAAPEDFVQE